MPGIHLNGIYSHLAQAANPDQTLTANKKQHFHKCWKQLRKREHPYSV